MNNEVIVSIPVCIGVLNKDSISDNKVLNNNNIGKEVLSLNPNNTTINQEKDFFPYCIVWTHLPWISVILPFVGHTAICSSKGMVHEFAGHHQININHLSFGKPVKYVQCKLTPQEQAKWDQLIDESDFHYCQTSHHLLLYDTSY